MNNYIMNKYSHNLFQMITLMGIIYFQTSCSNKQANQSKSEVNIAKNNNFTKTYKGSLNNKFQISMTLIKTDNELNGTYSYIGKNTTLKLEGSIDNEGNISLNEFNNIGNITGNFKGQLNGTSINGIWSKPDGSNSMPFLITENYDSNINSGSISNPQKETTSNNNKSDLSPAGWGGVFKDEFGRTLLINNVYSDIFSFTFSPSYSDDCFESQMTGKGLISDYNDFVANFYDVNSDYSDEIQCQIDFILNANNKEIEVIERDCYHTRTCGDYNGSYKRSE